ncbi:CHASE3 domain-containing protein [Methylocystis sp. MJC1]|uniref:CHASE3 domain-containing protein n=1 Tax=Methylocystis sp. MJC1 TaxID=2654282 RepID=UPI0013ED3B1E|nr:CHASE3 domain-containing protein [Methylocystis sp. MJC1]KAF2991591.1 Blue-light-activated protein [Methylocystis sp. MJC1]MBU6527170.1 CHASE3 domain-containing protein [Methylocystis sp. MJC1]UZX13603.1 CHASE3 domain-containing protein [Methylocystis sp. MJC1]
MAETRKFLSVETISLIVAFAILAFAGFVTARTEQQRRESGAWVRHTLVVESALYRLDGAIRRAESEERGYIITRDRAYLRPKDEIATQLEKGLAEVGALVADDSEQAERLSELRPLIEERLEQLQHKIDIMRAGDFEAAAEIVRTGEGKALTDRIDALVAEMIAQEDALHRQRDLQMSEATDTLQTAIGSLIVLIAGVAVLAVLLTERQLHALRKSSESLKLAYNELIAESTKRGSLEAQLRQSQKLEALGHLAGGIAHDFNNMLGVIVSSLNILRRKLRRNEGGLDPLIDSAMDGADRAAALVRRLLAFSRIQPLNPEPLDVNSLVIGMSAILHRTLGAHIHLATVLAPDLWPTRVDANELESAVLNLAVNARDAMPTGGQLTIETQNTELDACYTDENPSVRPGQYVMIVISDTGVGMPPDVAAKAFDPFFTTKPIGKGTGLGLSQAHGFATQSNGHIKIYSEVGRGTCLKLYLPRYLEDSEAVEAPPQPQPQPPEEEFPRGRPGEIVLIVEDDEKARQATAQGVRELGYTVLEAESGKEAIRLLRARGDISLMITDIVMPEMDGARLAREAVFRRHALHVMFITGYSQHAIARDGMLDPDVNLLTKPFSLAQLARKIRDVLDARGDLPKGKP